MTENGVSVIEKENKNLGENIRLYRIRAGLSIKELSKRILKHHDLLIKPGSIRNYEKGKEKIPAVVLNSIAAITKIDLKEFYEPAHPMKLLDTVNKIHLLEAYSMIRCQSARDALLHLARRLGR